MSHSTTLLKWRMTWRCMTGLMEKEELKIMWKEPWLNWSTVMILYPEELRRARPPCVLKEFQPSASLIQSKSLPTESSCSLLFLLQLTINHTVRCLVLLRKESVISTRALHCRISSQSCLVQVWLTSACLATVSDAIAFQKDHSQVGDLYFLTHNSWHLRHRQWSTVLTCS
jgi:hypothetical protein